MTWHHFDPPWSEKQHHDPAGMIALCQEHHSKADSGSFTKEQLREFKTKGTDEKVQARIDWMRKSIVLVSGGMVVQQIYILLRIGGRPVIWFNRDENNYLLLNIDFYDDELGQIFKMEDNFWSIEMPPTDLVCPPKGNFLEMKYGDLYLIRIEFKEIENADTFQKEYKRVVPDDAKTWFPSSIVQLDFIDKKRKISMNSLKTNMSGLMVQDMWVRMAREGFNF